MLFLVVIVLLLVLLAFDEPDDPTGRSRIVA